MFYSNIMSRHFSPSYTLGLIFIVCVSLIWAAASVLVQFLYNNPEISFGSPFLLTYTGVSLFTCFLPFQWLRQRCRCCRFCRCRCWNGTAIPAINDGLSNADGVSTTLEEEDIGDGGGGYESIQTFEVSDRFGIHDAGANSHGGWTVRDHMVAAAKIAPVWFLSNYSYNASLKYTSITSSTVLASTGSLFTFLFALISRDERFNLYKFFGIFLGMAGSIVTGLHDIQRSNNDNDNNNNNAEGDDREEQLWGDFLGLLSAVGYGGYALMVRLLCPKDESLMSMQLFLGFVGLWNMLLLSPIAVYQGFFQSTGGMTWFLFGCLVAKGLLDNVLSDYLWARAVVLTSATVATVGLGLTIPLAFGTDIALGRPNVLDAASIVGALSVLLGFVLVNIGQQEEDEDEQHHDHSHPYGAPAYSHLAPSNSTSTSRSSAIRRENLQDLGDGGVSDDCPGQHDESCGNHGSLGVVVERLPMSVENRDETAPFQNQNE